MHKLGPERFLRDVLNSHYGVRQIARLLENQPSSFQANTVPKGSVLEDGGICPLAG